MLPFLSADEGTRETALFAGSAEPESSRGEKWTLARIAAESEVCEDTVGRRISLVIRKKEDRSSSSEHKA